MTHQRLLSQTPLDNAQVWQKRRADYNGANVQTVVSGLSRITGFDVDDVGDTLYWTDADALRRADAAATPLAMALAPYLPVGDVNGDGLVNIDDLVIVITSWGPCANPDCPGDIDHNGVVNIDDLVAVITAWSV